MINDLCTYEGQWVNGAKCGYGVVTHADGAVFSGIFDHNCKDGHGKQIYVNGDVYVGQWFEDKKCE